MAGTDQSSRCNKKQRQAGWGVADERRMAPVGIRCVGGGSGVVAEGAPTGRRGRERDRPLESWCPHSLSPLYLSAAHQHSLASPLRAAACFNQSCLVGVNGTPICLSSFAFLLGKPCYNLALDKTTTSLAHLSTQ